MARLKRTGPPACAPLTQNVCVLSYILQKENSPLHIACLNGHTDIVRSLLDYGCSIDVQNNVSALSVIAQGGYLLRVSQIPQSESVR